MLRYLLLSRATLCLQGVEHGISQIAKKAGTNPVMVWNYPIDITFKALNVHGWPQIILSVYGLNFWAKDVIYGYGCTNIPTVPGRCVLALNFR